VEFGKFSDLKDSVDDILLYNNVKQNCFPSTVRVSVSLCLGQLGALRFEPALLTERVNLHDVPCPSSSSSRFDFDIEELIRATYRTMHRPNRRFIFEKKKEKIKKNVGTVSLFNPHIAGRSFRNASRFSRSLEGERSRETTSGWNS